MSAVTYGSFTTSHKYGGVAVRKSATVDAGGRRGAYDADMIDPATGKTKLISDAAVRDPLNEYALNQGLEDTERKASAVVRFYQKPDEALKECRLQKAMARYELNAQMADYIVKLRSRREGMSYAQAKKQALARYGRLLAEEYHDIEVESGVLVIASGLKESAPVLAPVVGQAATVR